MTGPELKLLIADLGLYQFDFAVAVGVTPRAVAMWIGGERAIPGPVEAYLRLLRACPPGVRAFEINQFRKERTMRNGMYGIHYASVGGPGKGALILQDGSVFGADEGGGRYDGQYVMNGETGLAEVSVKVAMPANVPSVIGITHPFEWSLDVALNLDPTKDVQDIVVAAPFAGASIDLKVVYLRGLPQ